MHLMRLPQPFVDDLMKPWLSSYCLGHYSLQGEKCWTLKARNLATTYTAKHGDRIVKKVGATLRALENLLYFDIAGENKSGVFEATTYLTFSLP